MWKMWKRFVSMSLGLTMGLVLAINMTIAQNETIVPAYLNFEQFRTVVDADKLGFYGTLKYAGMKFVNAPAAGRVVSLYEYDAESIVVNSSCSGEYKSEYALLVNWAVPSKAVEARWSPDMLGETTEQAEWASDVWEEDLHKMLVDRDWILVETLSSYDSEGKLKGIIPEPVPVWYEVPFVNACELQRSVENLDDGAWNWNQVSDDKLKRIAEYPWVNKGENHDAWPVHSTHVIVTEPISEAGDYVEYFAECQDIAFIRDGLGVPATSLCNWSVE